MLLKKKKNQSKIIKKKKPEKLTSRLKLNLKKKRISNLSFKTLFQFTPSKFRLRFNSSLTVEQLNKLFTTVPFTICQVSNSKESRITTYPFFSHNNSSNFGFFQVSQFNMSKAFENISLVKEMKRVALVTLQDQRRFLNSKISDKKLYSLVPRLRYQIKSISRISTVDYKGCWDSHDNYENTLLDYSPKKKSLFFPPPMRRIPLSKIKLSKKKNEQFQPKFKNIQKKGKKF